MTWTTDELFALAENGRKLLAETAKIQDLTDLAGDFPAKERHELATRLSHEYHTWYAKAMAAVPPQDAKEIEKLYNGIPFFSPAIKDFLASPLAINGLWNDEKVRMLLTSPFVHSYDQCFKRAMLQQAFLDGNPYENNVFLMMKYRSHNSHIAEIIKAGVVTAGKRVVLAKSTRITDELGTNVLACLLCCKYGIALFDEPEEQQEINPNVAYELGIMHYLDRSCLILKSKNVRLQTDILAKLYTEYDPASPGDLIPLVQNWFQGATRH